MPGPSSSTGRTSNLRGSLFRNFRTVQPQSPNVNVSIERDARFKLPKLPEVFSKYPDWVTSAEGAILGCGLSWRDIERYLDLMNDKRIPVERMSDHFDNDNQKNLDIKVYSEVLAICTGPHSKFVSTIRTEVERGNGVAAMRKLHSLEMYEVKLLAMKAEKQIMLRKCGGMDDLEDYVRESKNDLNTLVDCKIPFSETMFFELMKENMNPYGDKSGMNSVSALFADYERNIVKDPSTSVQTLLEILEKVGREHTEKRQIRKSGNLGRQPQKDGNQDWCTTCKGKPHLKKDCWVTHPHLNPYKKGDKGKGGKGKGGYGGKGGDGKNAWSPAANQWGQQKWGQPGWQQQQNQWRGGNGGGKGGKGGDGGPGGQKEKCKYCGRRNHASKDCKYKPPGDDDAKLGDVGIVADNADGPFAEPSTGPAKKTTSLLAFLRGDLPRRKLGQVAVRKDSLKENESSGSSTKHKSKPQPPDHPRIGCCWCHENQRDNTDLTLYYCGYCDHKTCYECSLVARTPKGHGVIICKHCRAGPSPGKTKHHCPDIITCNIARLQTEFAETATCNVARYQMDVDDTAFDTAATDNIFNENSSLVVEQGTSNRTTIIEGVGGDISTSKSATIRIPCINIEKSSLTVPKIGTNAVAGNRLIHEDDYIFIWGKRFGANLIGQNDYLRFDEVNGVPLFPTPGRPSELQDLCDAGYAAEIRKLESASDEELQQFADEMYEVNNTYDSHTAAFRSEEEYLNYDIAVCLIISCENSLEFLVPKFVQVCHVDSTQRSIADERTSARSTLKFISITLVDNIVDFTSKH